jgi:hypothetical protein
MLHRRAARLSGGGIPEAHGSVPRPRQDAGFRLVEPRAIHPETSGFESQAERGSMPFRCERTYGVTLQAKINAAESRLTK